MTHKRAAHCSRTPRPSTSGIAAPATSNQTRGDWATGPMAKRMTSPQSGAVAPAMGRPKICTEALPASAVPMTHGASSRRATATASIPTTTTRQPASRPLTRSAPIGQASAARSTSGTTAGAKPAAAAMMAPSTATWPRCRLRQRGPGSTSKGGWPEARARRSAMKGKAA